MIKKYADVIVDISHGKVDRPFQYKIPESFRNKLKVGMCVRIPFGRGNNLREGYVIDITDDTDYPEEKIKELKGIVTDNIPIESRSIELAWWMKNRYGSTMITALKTVLPVKQEMKPATYREVTLAVSREEACSYLAQALGKHQMGKVRLLETLLEGVTVSYSMLTSRLSISPQTIRSMESQGIVRIDVFQNYRNPIHFSVPLEEKKELTEKQQYIVDSFLKDYDREIRNPVLLHGVTGSGKTEVYMDLIEGMLKRGRETIVLIPEIALTYQTVLRFYKRFGDVVSLVNSRLSAGEKYDQFQRAKEGSVKIMIGPRSALFTPFRNLGLIIIDEEHESSYKSDSVPKYHARETAVQLAGMTGACVVLGSATPSLEASYRAEKGEYRKFVLSERIGKAVLPSVSVVDMRRELKEGNTSVFSRSLQEKIARRLENKEQIMLFLNRRGMAGFVSCRSCGHVLKCPHCDVSLSEHKNKMACHYCGYEAGKVTACPRCGSRYIFGFKAGTQQIEEKVKEMFPSARVLRMDADTTKKKDDYEKILSAFANEEADILIGTQMIVKGHDFKNVTLVGVLAADLSLHASDYRAGERTFQLLVQAVGRAGRGEKAGEAIVQTYQPEHYSIQHCTSQDYDSFYKEEVAYREWMEYPPVSHMLAVLMLGKDERVTMEAAKESAAYLKENLFPGEEEALTVSLQKGQNAVRIIGPAPASIGKINDYYRQVLYVKCRETGKLVRAKDLLEKFWKEKEEIYRNCTVYFDFDPVNGY